MITEIICRYSHRYLMHFIIDHFAACVISSAVLSFAAVCFTCLCSLCRWIVSVTWNTWGHRCDPWLFKPGCGTTLSLTWCQSLLLCHCCYCRSFCFLLQAPICFGYAALVLCFAVMHLKTHTHTYSPLMHLIWLIALISTCYTFENLWTLYFGLIYLNVSYVET